MHGEVYLKIEIQPVQHMVTVERFFHVYTYGGYMENRNLGYIDSIRIGSCHWFVFEDDFYQGE